MKILNFSYLDIDKKVISEEEFFNELVNKKFDLIIIDFEYYSSLFEAKHLTKAIIIFVTSYCDSFIYKKSLQIGNYCFSYDEIDKLLIRIDYLKKQIFKIEVFKYKNLLFKLNGELYKDLELIKISLAEKELLKVLIKYKNRFISKEEILEECEHIDSIDSIKVLISRLRKIGFDIINQKNQGYKIKDN